MTKFSCLTKDLLKALFYWVLGLKLLIDKFHFYKFKSHVWKKLGSQASDSNNLHFGYNWIISDWVVNYKILILPTWIPLSFWLGLWLWFSIFIKSVNLLTPGVFGDFQPGQAFLSTSTTFYDIFSLLWATFYWACFQFKKFWDTIIKMGKFYHILGICSQKQVCSEFICQISQHFRAYLRLHWPDHSDLGIIGKTISSSGSGVQMVPILVKADDVINKGQNRS